MHPTALKNCELFFDVYSSAYDDLSNVLVIDIGSQDVNGSLRTVVNKRFEYIGVDFTEGKGVDIVLDDPYILPFENESVDIVLSSSCFEHSEMFWLVFLEILRILKPAGLFYLNVPSNGAFHRYPVDCWRFYPDSGSALVSWAKRNGVNAALLESYTCNQKDDLWNDFVGVFLKDQAFGHKFPKRILDTIDNFRNGIVGGSERFLNESLHQEDYLKLIAIQKIINNEIQIK